MARTARASKGEVCYHVINRGNNRSTVFLERPDYAAFVRFVLQAKKRIPLRVLAFCLMPNHFHLVLWPYEDGDLSRWMQWLLTCQVRRHHRVHGTSGRVWQGRFKAFPIQRDHHLLKVMRYVERNPLRANLVDAASDWEWSSIGRRSSARWPGLISAGPILKPANWEQLVDTITNSDELAAMRECGNRNAPYGDKAWVLQTARDLGLEASIRPRGRPRRT